MAAVQRNTSVLRLLQVPYIAGTFYKAFDIRGVEDEIHNCYARHRKIHGVLEELKFWFYQGDDRIGSLMLRQNIVHL